MSKQAHHIFIACINCIIIIIIIIYLKDNFCCTQTFCLLLLLFCLLLLTLRFIWNYCSLLPNTNSEAYMLTNTRLLLQQFFPILQMVDEEVVSSLYICHSSLICEDTWQSVVKPTSTSGLATRGFLNISLYKAQGSVRWPWTARVRCCALLTLSIKFYNHLINSRKWDWKVFLYFALTKSAFILTHNGTSLKFGNF